MGRKRGLWESSEGLSAEAAGDKAQAGLTGERGLRPAIALR